MISLGQKKIVVFVDLLTQEMTDAVHANFENAKILLLRDVKYKLKDSGKTLPAEYVEYVDFTKPTQIAKALLPYYDDLYVITGRGEAGASRLSEVIPHVPYLRTPTPDSLRWATDKYEMRRRFNLYNRKINPRFTKVKNNTKKERKRVIEKVSFPMIVKPANLESSMLVTICYHEEELEKALRSIFRKLKKMYESMNRLQEPTVMAEQYMDGDMYSVDSYVNSRGKIFHCPLVRIKTGRNIGHDDFYNYLRITPTALKKETIANAEQVTEDAIHALGLRSTTVHTELIKIDDEWKIIEVGPRVGGYRPVLYKLSCDIDHTLNDLLVRVPKTPIIPKKCKGFAATMIYYPELEGKIESVSGIKKIKDLESFKKLNVKLKVGDKVLFSKNGGKGVFDVTLYNPDRSKLLADIRRIEQMVEVKVASGRSKKKVETTKKVSDKQAAKKVPKTVAPSAKSKKSAN